jgi:hypothetical protein
VATSSSSLKAIPSRSRGSLAGSGAADSNSVSSSIFDRQYTPAKIQVRYGPYPSFVSWMVAREMSLGRRHHG